jgi:outer membrane protein assembly factor BamB
MGVTFGSSLFYTASAKGPLEARSPADGRVVWSRPIGADTDLVASQDLLFVRGFGTLHALDQASGRTRWTMAAASGMPRPMARAGWLIVATGQSIRAFRASDGSAVWQRDVEAPVSRPFALDGDRLFAVVGSSQLVAMDVRTGEVQSRAPVESHPDALLALDERVYYGAGGFFVAYRQQPVRYDWSVRIFAPIVGEPAGDARYVYVAMLDNSVRLFDRDQGTERHKFVLPSRPAPDIFKAGKYLIVPVHAGSLVVFDPDSRRIAGVLAVEKPADQALILPALEAAAGSDDGTALVRVVTSQIAGTRSLTGFRRVK